MQRREKILMALLLGAVIVWRGWGIVRGVFLKGSGLDTLWPNYVALAIFGVVILGLSVKRFHKHLD